MRIEKLIRHKRHRILSIAANHGVRHVRIFGSVSRGEAGPDSDVDFLVELEPGRTLLDLGGFMMDLKDLLGRKVDVVTDKGLHPCIRKEVLKEALPL